MRDAATKLSDEEKLIDTAEMAVRLKAAPNFVREQVILGRIPCIRFNARTWRYHWPTVLKALQQN